MKIAIINLTGGGISGGYKKYLINVLPRIAVHSEVEAILCASPKPIKVQDWFEFLPKINFIACKPFSFIHYTPEHELKKSLEIFSPDVIFIPVERYFKFSRVPIVNMIQNMEPFAENIDGNSFTDKCRLCIQLFMARRAIKKTDRTIALSKYVKEFLLHQWKVPKEKIGLVYHGIELPLTREYVRPNNIPKDWEGNFLFTAGSIRPARGLEDILGAMKYLMLDKQNIKGLAIAGETELRMISYQRKLEKWIKMNNLSSKICWAGKLSEKEMNWCYSNCKIFVMTSRVESFGMIAGEAMAHGCVCISSDSPCLPEIFGEAAVFYPSKRGEVLTEAIKTVFRWDSYKCKEMSERARRQAAKFSWDITTEKLLAEFKKVIKN
ncbi:MAG: glycosyltransferase [Atribacterota bacterium]|nr:glycosyltransferase [Atribacterota bacterium]